MIDYHIDVEPLLAGRWQEIFSCYGIKLPRFRGLNSINIPCPICGGIDRAHWRIASGRLSLFCRNCACDKMLSPEQVLMTVTGLGFADLVKELARFADCADDEQVTQAKLAAKALPHRNMPVSHVQDFESCAKFLSDKAVSDKCYPFLRSNSVAYPVPIYCAGDTPFFTISNENNVIVNIAAPLNDKLTFLAGGISYGAWHTIPSADNNSSIIWVSDLIFGLHQHYKNGAEIRVCFDIYNLKWCQTVGIIKSHHEIILKNEEEKYIMET